MPPSHAPDAPPVIGLTGSIGSGKSTVSHLLAEWGAHVIDADRIGHAVIAPLGEAYGEVVAAFGPEILAEDGTIARRKLGAIVFADPARLAELNGISHPRMAERMAREIDAERRRALVARPPAIVLDAAILFEAGWAHLCDAVWTVEAPAEVVIERLVQRDRMSRSDAQARLDAQLGSAERMQRAQHVIHNEGSLDALREQVQHLWQQSIAG